MSYNITFEDDDDGLRVYLTDIVKDAEKTEREMLEETGDQLKEYIVANLNKHRRVLKNRHRVAMADDVKKTIRTDKWGRKYVSIRGGKKTGTLWHIVNDGHLHSMGIHFMDGALARLDGTMDELWNKIMR